jgi:hypothetical protein
VIISDLSPSPFDSPVIARLKRDSNGLLATLPQDEAKALRIVGQKLDYFSAAGLRIRPKETEGGLAPFFYNPIQLDYLAGLRLRHRLTYGIDIFRGIRDIILKPRQLGFTTFIASLFFLDGLLHPGRNSLVLTHLDKVSQKVLDIYRTFYDCLIPEMKASTRLRRASANHLELEFLGPDGLPDPVKMPSSAFMVHTAEGLDMRGLTFQNVHGSEAAFYSDWPMLVRGVLQTVPRSGNIILESTANGFNHYKEMVDASLDGTGKYRLVFYPWFAHPEYAIDLTPEATARLLEALTKEERMLVATQDVTLPQISWRREKLAEMNGFVDSFRQEYPANIQDAFISSGRPIFDLVTVSRNWELAKRTGPIEIPEDGVFIYLDYEPGMEVVGGGDPAEGIDKGEGDPMNEIGGTDFSSGFFVDARTLRTVAHVHGRWEPAEFARIMARVGARYDAMIAIERNNHGHLVLYALEEAGYPRLYRHLEYDAAGAQFLKLGFPMTPQTKPLVVDCLAEVVRRDSLPCSVHRFWYECTVFVRDPAGKAGAMPTRHDDRVMSMAITIYLCTIGAKSWGGSGTLIGADAAGLPKPGNVNVPQPAKLAPALVGADGRVLEAGIPASLGLPPVLENTPEGSHPLFMRLQAMRQEAASPENPCCGNCLNKATTNGALFCKPQGFGIKPTDPPCSLWDPEAPSGYNERDPFEIDIQSGGPHGA